MIIIYLILEFIHFIYYVYVYFRYIYRIKKRVFNNDEVKLVINTYKTLDKKTIEYLLKKTIYYDKELHKDVFMNKLEIKNFSRDEIKNILKFAILNQNDNNDYENELVELVNFTEKKLEIEFDDKKKSKYIYFNWNKNYVEFYYRFLICNIIVKTLTFLIHRYMLYKKYEYYNLEGNISFLYKNNGKKDTIMVIHGFGIGYIPYLSKINLLNEKYNVIILILPNISGYYNNIFPNIDVITNSVDKFLEMKKINKYYILSHSFGTFISQIILNNDKNNKIMKIIKIDPIIFWISSFSILSFTHNKEHINYLLNYKSIYNIIVNIFVNSDIYVNYICHRLLYPFDFLIINTDNKVKYYISREDRILDTNILYNMYKNDNNVEFIDNVEHGDIITNSEYSHIFEKITLQYEKKN